MTEARRRLPYSAVSTRLPTTPTPSTCFSNNCTFSLSSSNLCFSSIHRISRRSYRLPSACKLPIAVSNARRRSSSRRRCCSRVIHHATTTRPARVIRVATTSARRGGARTVRQRRIGCIPYRSTRGGSCRGGQRATLRNGACLCERVQRATRGWYQSRDREHGTVMMMRDQKPN
jgi:hypothetical protein